MLQFQKNIKRMFENLSDRLDRSFKLLKGQGKITEINIAETLKDIRRALLDADVNFKIAKKFTDDVKQKALGQQVLTAVKPGQLMVKIVKDELAALMGGTFTISNGGVFGSMLSTPILNPPQSAILGMHTIQQRAVVVNGEIVIRPMMYLALSYDHRIVDGRDAVQFLVRIKENLQDPGRMLLDV